MPIRYRSWFIDKMLEDQKRVAEERDGEKITQETGPTVSLLGTRKSFS